MNTLTRPVIKAQYGCQLPVIHERLHLAQTCGRSRPNAEYQGFELNALKPTLLVADPGCTGS
jgi:hypothetical protein